MVNGDCVYKYILAQWRSSGDAAGSGIGARAHRGHQVVPGDPGTGENQTHVIGCTQRHSWAVANGGKCGQTRLHRWLHPGEMNPGISLQLCDSCRQCNCHLTWSEREESRTRSNHHQPVALTLASGYCGEARKRVHTHTRTHTRTARTHARKHARTHAHV